MLANYKICKKTVMDITDKYIKFDEEGISNHFWDFQKYIKPNWDKSINKSDKVYLERIIDKIKKKGKGKDFDCIVGLSGGMDSSYMIHVLVKEFGLRPLAFHVDGGWNSDIAVSNINKLIDKLNLDLFTEVINWQEMKEFQLAMFKSGLPHLDIPQDMAFIATLYKFANKYSIKYIMNGGNISTECVLMPLNIFYWGTDMIHIRDILNKFADRPLESFPFSSIYYHKIYLRYIKQIKVVKPLNFVPYYKLKAQKLLEQSYGWIPYKQKHFESRFTKFLEGYWLPTRFNYDMRRNQLSSLILTEQLERDEALKILESKPYSQKDIHNEKNFIADKLDISINQLEKYHSMDLKFYWNYKNQKNLFDLGEKVLSKLRITRRGGAY